MSYDAGTQVLDGASVRTLSRVAFLASFSRGAVATEYAHIQFWNPIDSGKNAFIEQIGFLANTALTATIRAATTMLVNLGANPANKLVGAVASVMEIRHESFGAVQGTLMLELGIPAASTLVFWRFTNPIMVPPGKGLMIAANTVNQLLEANFEHWEASV